MPAAERLLFASLSLSLSPPSGALSGPVGPSSRAVCTHEKAGLAAGEHRRTKLRAETPGRIE